MPLTKQLRSAMRELDLAVCAALAFRGPINATIVDALLSDLIEKLGALARQASPLYAKRQAQLGCSVFLATYSARSALKLLLPVFGALVVHATRLHTQLLAFERASESNASQNSLDEKTDQEEEEEEDVDEDLMNMEEDDQENRQQNVQAKENRYVEKKC